MKLMIAVRSAVMGDYLSAALPGFAVHICHTGAAALEYLERARPEILILELCLPDTDGFTLLQKSSYQPAHIWALTQLVTPALVQAAGALGIERLIPIPCSARYVARLVRDLTEKSPSWET